MSCKTCGAAAALALCSHCGHGYCGNHRGTLEGDVACTGCLRAEQERRAKAKQAKAARAAQGAAPASAASASAASGGASAPLPPLVEPAGWAPLGYGAAVGAASGGYGLWLVARLRVPHELPAWAPWVAGIGIALFAGAGVWAIAKTRAKR